jgi:hypothetical protein
MTPLLSLSIVDVDLNTIELCCLMARRMTVSAVWMSLWVKELPVS